MPSDAWLDLQSPWLAPHAPSASLKHRSTLFGPADATVVVSAPGQRCLTVEQLRQQHAVLRAAAQIHARGELPGIVCLNRHTHTHSVIGEVLGTVCAVCTL